MPFDSLPGRAVSAPDPRRCLDGSIDYAYCRFLALQSRAAAFARLGQTLAQAGAAVLIAWRERAKSRHALASMDERMRRDIGISRYEVMRETSKPFWQS